MNKNIKVLVGFSLKEADGEIGKIEDFYFDDISWKIRYLVVKTGNWFTGRKVLISPKSLQKPDWENEEFSVNLTKEQIKNSPNIDTDKPVSRQQEEQLYSYYPWGTYWGSDPHEHGAGIFGAMPSKLYNSKVEDATSGNAVAEQENNDHHLRSTENVTGYKIHATDGEIGKVVDYIFDDSTWEIKYLVIESGTWLDSRKVLLATQWIREVNWDNSAVIVGVSLAEVKNSPEFDIDQVLNESYERSLYDYYGKPGRS
ncbi:MAG TPA: PRC-barrel domain-containing protein [Hanamia sp.]|nr:PRC-barrel domain-containing protein [Hanamia sp.]